MTPCDSSKNRRFRGTYRLHFQDDKTIRTAVNISQNTAFFDLTQNSDIVYYHSLQNHFLSSRLMSIYVKIRSHIYNFDCGPVWVWILVSEINGESVWGCLRIGCWGEYLDRRLMKWQEYGGICQNTELLNYFYSLGKLKKITRKMKWVGHVQ
jgi:hypothetical protein